MSMEGPPASTPISGQETYITEDNPVVWSNDPVTSGDDTPSASSSEQDSEETSGDGESSADPSSIPEPPSYGQHSAEDPGLTPDGSSTASTQSEPLPRDGAYPYIFYGLSQSSDTSASDTSDGVPDLAFTDLDAQIPVLKDIIFKSRPLNHHAVDLSCDADLAVCADDSVHILLPEFPIPDEETPRPQRAQDAADDGGAEDSVESETTRRKQYHTHRGQYMAIMKPDPSVNRYLFESAGIDFDMDYDNADVPYHGVGTDLPTGFGSSLNQTVSVKWSPGGLGFNLRPVVAVLLTNGSILVYGEDGDRIKDIGSRKRSFAIWRTLWGVGGILPLPDSTKASGQYLPLDKITSMAWAKGVDRGRTLLSYTTSKNEIVILSVQYATFSTGASPSWRINEIARFPNWGPHPDLNIMDPDYVPYGSAYALAWSPWHSNGDSKTAVLAHIARCYVGFRRVTITKKWERGEQAVSLTVEEQDFNGLCTNTLVNSFVAFQDAIWSQGNKQLCMGMIASPAKCHVFQACLNSKQNLIPPPHSSNECGTTYPVDCRRVDQNNPITGLYMLPPTPNNPAPVPYYSLVRLSATSTNTNWAQTNIPGETDILPQWNDHIESLTSISVPVAMAGRDADSDASGEESDASSDDFDMPEEAGEQINPWRVRIWGLAASVGGGMSVALLSQHSTLGPDRKPKSKIVFAWKDRREEGGEDIDMLGQTTNTSTDNNNNELRLDPGFTPYLSTEAKMWEWMYGGGPVVPFTIGDPDVPSGWQALRGEFEEAINAQTCIFCSLPVEDTGRYSLCDRKHSFATCASTGLAIMAPGISHACGICGLRTLSANAMEQAAEKHGVSLALISEAPVEACGGCGGKFIA